LNAAVETVALEDRPTLDWARGAQREHGTNARTTRGLSEVLATCVMRVDRVSAVGRVAGTGTARLSHHVKV
jgi:hypothetical protein